MAELPSWQPFRDGDLPLPGGDRASGRVVAVLASEGVEDGWAADAVSAVARAWSSRGRKVVLTDCWLQRPTLHVSAGMDNEEGVADAVLYGLSVPRVARPVDGGAFFLVTAGTPVADAASVAGDPRWGRLLDGFVEAGVTLMVFLRAQDEGVDVFLERASDVIVFGGQGESMPGASARVLDRVRVVTGPGVGAEPVDGWSASGGASSPAAEQPEAVARTEVMDFSAAKALSDDDSRPWTAGRKGASESPPPAGRSEWGAPTRLAAGSRGGPRQAWKRVTDRGPLLLGLALFVVLVIVFVVLLGLVRTGDLSFVGAGGTVLAETG